MLMLEGVTAQTDRNRQVTMTHDTTDNGKAHTLSFYQPNPAAGPFAGKLIARYVLSAAQVKELKAHL